MWPLIDWVKFCVLETGCPGHEVSSLLIQRQLCGYARGLATQRATVPHKGNTMVTQSPNSARTVRPLHNRPSASPREMTLSALWHEPIKPLDTWAAMASRRTAFLLLTVSGTLPTLLSWVMKQGFSDRWALSGP